MLRAAFDRFYQRSEQITKSHEGDYPENMSDSQVLEKYLAHLQEFTIGQIHLMRAANHSNDAHSFERMVTARSVSADWLAKRLKTSKYERQELKKRCHFILRVATATYRDTFLSGCGAIESRNSFLKTNKPELDLLKESLAEMSIKYLDIQR